MPGGLKQAAKQLIWSVPVAIAFTDVVGSAIKVEGLSMRPTLNPEGSTYCDWVLVDKASIKLLRDYHRGDVVVLWKPDDPHGLLIKRLIALEGDTVSLPGKAQRDEHIPQGRCWVEGDNPHAIADPSLSSDSRSAYGPVHLGLLEGRVTHIIWPPHRMGPVDRRPQAWRVATPDHGHGFA